MSAGPEVTHLAEPRVETTATPVDTAPIPADAGLGPRKVVVTMPAYHAGATLERTLADLPEHLAQHVILVDDASTDNTVEVAESLGITVLRHHRNRGYGGNQKTCYQAALQAGADIVVMLHPDYQYDPTAVPLLIGPLLSGDADMTFGSRFAGMADPRAGGMPMYRFLGNRVTTTIQNQLLGTRFSELHSGMRAYTRGCLLRLPFLAYSDDFDFDAQVLCDAITSDMRVVEVPIPTRYTKESSSIAVGPSLRYVARSVTTATAARVRNGRRGSRSPIHSRHPARRLPSHGPVEATCVLCGPVRHAIVRSSSPAGHHDPTVDPGAPDDAVVQCTSCGLTRALDAPQTEPAAGTTPAPRTLDRLEAFARTGSRLVTFGPRAVDVAREAQRRRWSVTAVVDSVEDVEPTRRAHGLAVVAGDLVGFDSTHEPYDAVCVTGLLDDRADPVAALHAAAALVRVDGALVVSCRVGSDRNLGAPQMDGGQHWQLTPATLRAILTATGFEAVGVDRPPAGTATVVARRVDG